MDIWPKDRGAYYGAFAFASVVLGCYAGYFNTRTFYGSEWMCLLSFGLGAAYVALGILGTDFADHGDRRTAAVYFTAQCVLLTAIVFLSPIRGFMGIVVLPVASQAVLLLGWRPATLICLYLFGINIALWGLPFGWGAAFQAIISYSAGFAFTIVFTAITRQALEARAASERLRHELAEANALLRAQAEQTAELATTRERNRVAREIHDGVGHYLTVIKTQLDAATALLPAQPDRAREAAGKAAKLAAEALDDVRRSVGALRTDTARPPLPDALRELAAHGDPVPTLAIDGEPRPVEPGIEHALYRAAQEGLTNIRRHARASRAVLRLDFRAPRKIVLELADNGVGTTPGTNGTGFGLRGLGERIELLGGTVSSGNRLEGGFTLRVEIPA